MRAARLFLATVACLSGLSACSVNTLGAACSTDDECPLDQHCEPKSDGGTLAVEESPSGQRPGACRTGPRTLDSACGTLVEQIAARAAGCYGGTMDSWVRVSGAAKLCQGLVADGTLSSDGFTFEPLQFGACQKALHALTCDQLLVGTVENDILSLGFAARANDTALINLLESCAVALHPARAAGETCNTTADCVEGYCDTNATCPGVCRSYVPAGSPCEQNTRCAPGSVCASGACLRYAQLNEPCASNPCNPTLRCGDDKTCHPRGGLQSACNAHDDCAPNLRCQETGGSKTCQSALALGAPCIVGEKACDLFTYCSKGTQKCTPWPTAAGSACGNVEGQDGETALCIGTYCAVGPLLVTTCRDYLATNQDCQGQGALGGCGPNALCIDQGASQLCRPRSCL